MYAVLTTFKGYKLQKREESCLQYSLNSWPYSTCNCLEWTFKNY